MPEYQVTYKIDIDANSHENAAREVWNIFRDPHAFPPVFKVKELKNPDDTLPAILIDCEDIDGENN